MPTMDEISLTPEQNMPSAAAAVEVRRPRIRFDRNEFAGSFGDMGTDVPLLIGVTLASGLNGTSVLMMFGALQILSGLAYRLPMPVQPLKAMAAIVIATKTSPEILFGGGLAIGVVMLVLAMTGLLDWLAAVVPKSVVRGIQFGLGLQLATVALTRFVQADGVVGYCMAFVAFVIIVVLLGNRRLPAAIPVVLLGLLYAMFFKLDLAVLSRSFSVGCPEFRVPEFADILAGFVLLALPQIPLSLGNSVLATKQLAEDLFPERRITIRRIGITYSILNLIAPWFGGIPTCHGSGGMAGHFAFGGRTGGSVIIYGTFLLLLGLFFGTGFEHLTTAFPLPILGVLLLFEALTLIWLIRDTVTERQDFGIVVLVGLLAVGLPYGYLVGIVLGTLLVRTSRWTRLLSPDVK
ncbi:MAG TPA: putative sulfate/molybdate transporter [Planctomycetota bacterium]|jgi:MFS superfamily sulfate permease-like transporter|nr:putative sulfate/molybdate transporter [Planctomycetota bacterium]